ncbi:MAG TPA: hypothetical protein DC049_20015 [Spirochaetia bacterium]|nr:hypothetical protein [Spirochaetia bacterium]
MDIINSLPSTRFHDIDEALAFVGIYDDQERTRSYLRMLAELKNEIRGKIVIEAGCGLGIFSEHMAKLGAEKVYAVEQNPALFSLARERLKKYPNIQAVHSSIEKFRPKEKISLLLHDFFGQFLYDESLESLSRLRFQPGIIAPDEGILGCGAASLADMNDPVINSSIMRSLSGVLISALFDEKKLSLEHDLLTWKAKNKFLKKSRHTIRHLKGDLLYFGIKILFRGRQYCISGKCRNWNFIWTHRSADQFELVFRTGSEIPEVFFKWNTG